MVIQVAAVVGLLATAARAQAPGPSPETGLRPESGPRPAAGGCVPGQFPVALDAGHSLARGGATSATGVPEYRFNAALALVVRESLQAAGFPATLVNPDGEDLSLRERPLRAERAQARLFLSLHHDSVQPRYLDRWQAGGVTRAYSDRFSGYSVFFSALNPRAAESERFARELAAALRASGATPTLHHSEPIPGEGRPLLDPRTGLYRYDGLAVLRLARIPAALLEAGIIVNRQDEPRLASRAYQQQVGRAVVQAVRRMCEAPARG